MSMADTLRTERKRLQQEFSAVVTHLKAVAGSTSKQAIRREEDE